MYLVQVYMDRVNQSYFFNFSVAGMLNLINKNYIITDNILTTPIEELFIVTTYAISLIIVKAIILF